MTGERKSQQEKNRGQKQPSYSKPDLRKGPRLGAITAQVPASQSG